MPVIDQCRNCGSTLRGEYCHKCGQRRLGAADMTLRDLLGRLLVAITDLDGRLFSTLRIFLSRPGLMLREYLEGARRRYLSPLALFLAANVAYFFFSPLTDLSMPLASQMMQWYGELARLMVDAKLATGDITAEQLAVAYNAETRNLGKTLVILHVPVFAVLLQLMFRGRRMYYGAHVQVAFSFATFLLLLAVVLPASLMLLFKVGNLFGLPMPPRDLARILGLSLLLGSVLWFSVDVLRRCYRQGWIGVFIRTPLFIAGFMLVHLWFYRPVLFLATIAAL